MKLLKGTKYDESKVQWHLLLDQLCEEIESVVRVLMFGAQKYEEENYKKVKNGEQRYRNACERHLRDISKGEINDKETGFPHYAHAICSLLFAFWHSRKKKK